MDISAIHKGKGKGYKGKGKNKGKGRKGNRGYKGYRGYNDKERVQKDMAKDHLDKELYTVEKDKDNNRTTQRKRKTCTRYVLLLQVWTTRPHCQTL